MEVYADETDIVVVDNYKLVSIISVACKAHGRLVGLARYQQSLSDSFGFVHQMSCGSNLFCSKVDVTSIMQGGDHPILCLIDGSMAGHLGLATRWLKDDCIQWVRLLNAYGNGRKNEV